MRLVELADSLERLEETRSRLRMVEHVAELLAHSARDERASIVYLLQARLRPDYEEIEVGLGEKGPRRSGLSRTAVRKNSSSTHTMFGRIWRAWCASHSTRASDRWLASGPSSASRCDLRWRNVSHPPPPSSRDWGKVQVEPKYDGLRLQFHRDGSRVWAFSRRLENVTKMFPDLAAALRRQLRTKRAIIEGEAIVHNPETGEFQPFQVTMTRKRKTRVAEMAERYPLRLFAFDILYAGHRNCIPDPLRARALRLRSALPFTEDSAVVVTESVTTSDAKELQGYFDDMIARGLEGVVAKRLNAPYQAGARGFDWVKLNRSYQSKLRDTVDVVLVAYFRGRGKRASLGIGSLVGAVYDSAYDRFRTVAKIGSRLSDAQWKELRVRLDKDAAARKPARVDSLLTPDVWVEPRYVVEVLADEITRSPSHTCGKSGDAPGYALRFPRVLRGVRVDKLATDATTQREIIQMYKLQRKT